MYLWLTIRTLTTLNFIEMKSIFGKIISGIAFVMAVFFAQNMQAQQNSIQEIKLSNQDGFNELRNLLISNFDFTNPDLSEGNVNSTIEFSVSVNGKLTNIHANGDCKYVSQELEEVMQNLLLKIKPNQLNGYSSSTKYILPVTVEISR